MAFELAEQKGNTSVPSMEQPEMEQPWELLKWALELEFVLETLSGNVTDELKVCKLESLKDKGLVLVLAVVREMHLVDSKDDPVAESLAVSMDGQ